MRKEMGAPEGRHNGRVTPLRGFKIMVGSTIPSPDGLGYYLPPLRGEEALPPRHITNESTLTLKIPSGCHYGGTSPGGLSLRLPTYTRNAANSPNITTAATRAGPDSSGFHSSFPVFSFTDAKK